MAEIHNQPSAGAAAPAEDQPACPLGAAPLPAPSRLPATPVEPLGEDASPHMTVGEHLDELRRRLLYALGGLALAMVVTLATGTWLLRCVEYPYVKVMADLHKPPNLVVLSVTTAFSMYVKLALYCGLLLSLPWIIYQLWMFVRAGLYPRERGYVSWGLPAAIFLFLLGAAMGAYVSIPTLKFFVTFGDYVGVTTTVTLDSYIDFLMQLLLVFGLAFEVPLVVLALARLGLIRMEHLRRYRKHVIVGMCTVAAIFAPADAISMVVMTLMLWALYETGAILAWLLIFRKKKAPGLRQ